MTTNSVDNLEDNSNENIQKEKEPFVANKAGCVIFAVIFIVICVFFYHKCSSSDDESENKSNSESVKKIENTENTNVSTETNLDIQVNDSWMEVAGGVWTGVKLYFGHDNNKKYIGEILGGGVDENGNKMILLEKDGNRFWKRRDHILSSYYYIKSNDPALKKMDWYNYSYE